MDNKNRCKLCEFEIEWNRTFCSDECADKWHRDNDIEFESEDDVDYTTDEEVSKQ